MRLAAFTPMAEFPDAIAGEVLRGTNYLPQRYGGSILLAGKLGLHGLITGEYNWQQITAGTITDGQIDMTLVELARAHKAFDIPWSVHAEDHPHYRADVARVRTVFEQTQRGIDVIACGAFQALAADRPQAKRRGASPFRRRFMQELSPEVHVLAELWHAATGGAMCSESQEINRLTRNTIKVLYSPTITAEEAKKYVNALDSVQPILSDIVAGAITEVVPEAEQYLGRRIHPGLAGWLASAFIAPVGLPQRRPSTVYTSYSPLR